MVLTLAMNDTFLHIRIPSDVREALDDIREGERPLPSRSEIVRRLILDAAKKKRRGQK